MNHLDRRYWLLIPAAIFTGVVSILSVYLSQVMEDYPLLLLMAMVICGGLPFISIGFILNKIDPSLKGLLTIGSIGVFITLSAVAVGTFTFIITIWLNALIVSICIGAAVAMMIMRIYIVNQYTVTNDALSKFTTFFTGGIGSAISLTIYEEWIPNQIMGDFPLNIMVGYTVFILFFHSTFLLSELKQNRKAITFWFFLVFSALLIDIFSKDLLSNLVTVWDLDWSG